MAGPFGGVPRQSFLNGKANIEISEDRLRASIWTARCTTFQNENKKIIGNFHKTNVMRLTFSSASTPLLILRNPSSLSSERARGAAVLETLTGLTIHPAKREISEAVAAPLWIVVDFCDE